MGAAINSPVHLPWRSRSTRRTCTTSPGLREDIEVVARDLVPPASRKTPHCSPKRKYTPLARRRSGAPTTRAVTAWPLRGGYFR